MIERRLLLNIFLFLCAVSAGALGGGEEAGEPPGRRAGPPAAGAEERREEREEMVRSQIEARGIRDPRVLSAMRNVPRHFFVTPAEQSAAYRDRPLPIGQGQTISQPYIVAYMTESLKLEGGEKVLEIGTGSGYQAAVLAEITPHVYSIEIIQELSEWGGGNLDRAGYGGVRVRNADGYFGWEEEAPFDAVIVTAAAGHIPPPLVAQLKAGGRIILPVGGVYQVQVLMLLTKSESGEIRTEQLLPVRFVPMTGTAMER